MASASESMNPSLVSELNLMHYVDLLRRRWLWVVICGILGAGVAGAWAFMTPSTYLAVSDLVISRTGSIVNFDPKFRTFSDTDPNAQGLDAVARRRSLVLIGNSTALTEHMIQQIGNQLPEDLRTPEALRDILAVWNDGDVIRVSARTKSPELAALITNTWAEIYVARVNKVFGESALAGDSLLTQVAELKKAYDDKQTAFTSYIGSTDAEKVLRERDLTVRQLNVDQEANLVRLISNATALRELVANTQADVSSSQEFALFMLQASAFNSAGDTPFRVDVPITTNLTPRARPQLVQELDTLIANLQARRAALAGPAREELYNKLNSLNMQIEQGQAKRKELEAERDLAWNTYQLLNNKVAENQVVSQTSSQLVQIVSPAVVPTEPQSRQTTLKTVLGALAGIVIGSALAVARKPR